MKTSKILVFDGHNDVLSKIFSEGGIAEAASFYNGRKARSTCKRRKWVVLGEAFLLYMSHHNLI